MIPAPDGFIFFACTFRAIRMKLYKVLGQFKLNSVALLSSECCVVKGAAVSLTVSENVGIYQDVYQSIWFKLGMMTVTTWLYIVILDHFK